MIAFRVDDMTCGHCSSTIAKALQVADRNARVTIDLSRHLVQIESASASAEALGAVIFEAGYTPVAAGVDAASATRA